jgi:hypothetical protein
MRNHYCGGFVQPEFSKTNRFKVAKSLFCIVFSIAAVVANTAQADGEITSLWQDSKLDLQLRNYYFSREFSDLKSPGPQRSAEWAQGAVGSFKSGYSTTALQVGFDLHAFAGVKLDSSRSKINSGLLALDDDGNAADSYGRLAGTLKLKAGSTELKVGELLPNLPVLTYSDIRLLPPSYQGASLHSSISNGLTLQAGYLESTSLRNRAGRDKLQAMLGHVPQRQVSSDSFRYLGVDYQLTANSQWRLWYAQLEDLYQQAYLNWQQQLAVTEHLQFKVNVGFFSAQEHGRALLNKLDNQALYLLFSLKQGAHTGYMGYQQMRGDSAFPRVFANVSILGNEVPTFEFASAGETSWQLRYDTDFSSLGMRGLSSSMRYIKSHGARVGTVTDGEAFERDLDLAYSVQQGALKGLSLRLRNVTARANYRTDIDENRIIVQYNFSFH